MSKEVSTTAYSVFHVQPEDGHCQAPKHVAVPYVVNTRLSLPLNKFDFMSTSQMEGTSKKLIIPDIRAAIHTQMTVNSFSPIDRQIESMFSTPQQIKSFVASDMLFICSHTRSDRIWGTAGQQLI